MAKNNSNHTKGQPIAVAMVDVLLERDGINYIAAPGQAFPFTGKKTTRHGVASIWLYYGLKKQNAYRTSKKTAHELLDCIVDGNNDMHLGTPGGVYVMTGETHPGMICTTQNPPAYNLLTVRDIAYMEGRSRDCMACAKRFLPYAYVPYTERMHKDCPMYPVREMYVPKKKGTEMEKVKLIRTDFPISFAEADKLVNAEDMKSPHIHNSLMAYQMYNICFFMDKYGFDTNEIYIGWDPEEPQCDTLVTRQEYETLLYGQDRTFRLKTTAPYTPEDPFGFFDVSRKRLCACICKGEWTPAILPSLY